ncbi:MAG: hypothetical protein R3A44_00695 [Caldilineaceae bacterium]
MRGAKEQLYPDLATDLCLRDDFVGDNRGAANPTQVTTAWQNFVGGAAGGVCLLRNVTRARQLLVQALAATDTAVYQPAVYLPANATHALVKDLKRTKAQLHFGALDADLNLTHATYAKISWAEPVLGLPTGSRGLAGYRVIDHAATVAVPSPPPMDADVQIYGLHLSPDTNDAGANDAGALMVFRDPALAEKVRRLITPADAPEWGWAAWQLERLYEHLPRQQAQLATLHHALAAAAGLPLLTIADAPALPHGVAVKLPDECAPATFYHYARGENTPVTWLPFVRPLHPAAVATSSDYASATAAHLERWVLAPLGLKTAPEELSQTVLGIVKAAEYLGIRWRTDPARAAAYAALLDERYGPGHDAYRPVFAIPPATLDTGTEAFADFAPPLCRLLDD